MVGVPPVEYAGIDLGSKEHYFCVVDASGKKKREGKVPNTEAGYRRLCARLRHPTHGTLPDVATESERGLFPITLRAEGFQVFLVSPLQTAALRRALGMGEDKSDSRDAEALAHGLRISGHRIRTMRGVSDHLRGLQALTRAHALAQERAEQDTAVLRSHLADYWPAFLDRYDATDLRRTPWTRTLAAAFPTPDALAAATDEALKEVLVAAGRERGFDRSITKDIRPIADNTVLRYPPLVEDTFGQITTLFVWQIHGSCYLAEQLEKKLLDLYLAHPFSDFFDSLPGVGYVTGARLLAEIGDDPFRFANPQALQAYGGCRPQTDASGGRRTVHRRRTRNTWLERPVTQWAGQISIPRRGGNPPLSPGAGLLYREQVGRSDKTINHAHRVVGKRLLGGLWHCLTLPARRPQYAHAYATWSDGKLFEREYANLTVLGQPAQPWVNLNPAERDHRKDKDIQALRHMPIVTQPIAATVAPVINLSAQSDSEAQFDDASPLNAAERIFLGSADALYHPTT